MKRLHSQVDPPSPCRGPGSCHCRIFGERSVSNRWFGSLAAKSCGRTADDESLLESNMWFCWKMCTWECGYRIPFDCQYLPADWISCGFCLCWYGHILEIIDCQWKLQNSLVVPECILNSRENFLGFLPLLDTQMHNYHLQWGLQCNTVMLQSTWPAIFLMWFISTQDIRMVKHDESRRFGEIFREQLLGYSLNNTWILRTFDISSPY